ncbi:MAG: PEGA domain-containing protein [Butyrivibrio sp.]|nr:PEGA domain-containing protein [Butyrivibrio sp.]
MRKIRLILAGLAIFACALMCACASSSSTRWHLKSTTDSARGDKPDETVGVVTSVDEKNKSISFISAEDGSTNIFPYNSGTTIHGKSGTDIVMAQITPGMIVDIFYDGTSKMVSRVEISDNKEVWENRGVTSFSVDDSKRSMRVGQSLYSYNDDTFVYSDGEKISMMELNGQDKLTVRGCGTRVLSVVVDKGHGYISLTGDSLFIGGYIDIGGSIVKVIEEDMLLIVREGNYKVEVRNGEYIAERRIEVVRNGNCELDFSDVVPNVTNNGNIRFNIDVDGALLYIDNAETKYSGMVVLPVGKHDIRVTASGYQTYTDTIEVDVSYRVIDIKLRKDEQMTETPKPTDGGEETTADENAATEAATSETRYPGQDVVSAVNDITVSGPAGGYVYFDGIYKGVAPVTFDMITGEHVISVLYNKEIKSYSVVLAEGGDDVVYDFTDK